MLICVFLILVFNLVNSSAFVCEKSTNTKTEELSHEERLRDDLLCYYQKYFLPLENRLDEMHIKIDININNYWISTSNPESLHIDTIITVTWIDFYLKWSPNDYNSINEIIIEADDIWRPQIVPKEMEAFSTKPPILDSSECKVTYEGNVSCKATSLHNGYCNSEIYKWPYELHECEVEYMLTRHNGETIITDIDENKTIHVNDENEGWKIIEKHIQTWQSKPDRNIYFDVIYLSFEVQRHIDNNPMQLFYITLFTLVSLTLLSFWTFFDDTSRLVLILINILCHFYQFRNLEFHLRGAIGHTIPCIVAFYRDSLILTFVQLVETIVLKQIFESEKPIPYLIRLFSDIASNNKIKQILLIQDNMEVIEIENRNNFRHIRNKKTTLRDVMLFIDRTFFLFVLIGYIAFLMSIPWII